MTSEEYDKLTDEEKQIKVAELCGWKRRPVDGNGIAWWEHPEHGRYKPDGVIRGCPYYITDVPDYLSDLNACHGFEKRLNLDQRVKYLKHLGWKVGSWQWVATHATAEQRCKAFVLTMTGGE